MENKRYHLLDNIRGLTLLSMICYHGAWDLVYLFGLNLSWYDKMPGYIWQQSICWIFIFLSGFCLQLGHHPFKRGIIVSAAGLLVTAVTVLFMPEERVIFGVLTLIGAAMIITAVLRSVLEKIPSSVGMIIAILLFFLFRNVNEWTFGFEAFSFGQIPEALRHSWILTFLGSPMYGFYSTDYFSIIPWLFLFLSGYYFYDIMDRKQWLKQLTRGEHSPLAWLGRHSLEIYLIHQPVLYGLFSLIAWIG